MFVYGVWWQEIEGPKRALVKLEQKEFLAAMEAALRATSGDVKAALEMIRADIVKQLRQRV